MNTKKIMKIDGSFGEGGGSILRICAGYSVLFNQPIKLYNIRANRSTPGLRLQHLLGLKTLAELTNGDLSECEVGTQEITFIPGTESLQDKIEVKIGTAASVGLLLQPIQIACLGFNEPDIVEINLKGGGTIGKWAPGLNYLDNVTYGFFRKAGFRVEIKIKKYGFYPKGGALTTCRLYPAKDHLKPLELTELGDISQIEGKIACTKSLSHAQVSERIKTSAEKAINEKLGIQTNINYEYVDSLSTGVGLSLWAESNTGAIISSGTVIGEKGTPSEEVGRNAAEKIIHYIKNDIPVDNYLSDQLIPLLGYIDQPSILKVSEITSHTKTNLELISRFTPRQYKIDTHKDFSIIHFE
jgi:RNA 3'-phosphate cyclase